MFYIHQTSCISPQHTVGDIDIDTLVAPVNKQLKAIEPAYTQIPPGVLRRMGKAVRIGVGAAMPLLQEKVDGIIIGTSNGGKEDCLSFLNQIIQYDEGLLTPLNFVQSTPNAVAAQIGLLTHNHGYNITHLHLGLSFEYSLIDADMLLSEHPERKYLVGAVDDDSPGNYILEDKGGWYKKEDVDTSTLYAHATPGSIGGEGAAMFVVNNETNGSVAAVRAVDTLHTHDETTLVNRLQHFLHNLPEGESIDLLLSGENGDNRLLKYYTACEEALGNPVVARFKHMCGEFPTAIAVGLWLACKIISTQSIPGHMIKYPGTANPVRNILIYNTYKGLQHSFILVTAS